MAGQQFLVCIRLNDKPLGRSPGVLNCPIAKFFFKLGRLLSAPAFAVLLAACGGGTNITPPPPAGGFSNASLNGQYAFSMVGVDTQSAYLARVGSFFADGNGSITSVFADVVEGNSGATQVTYTGGTYTIRQNGTGVMTFTSAGQASLQLSITLVSSTQGNMVETDLADVNSGSFFLQTPSAFTLNSLHGNFILDSVGVSFSPTLVTPLSIAGQIALDGNGNVTGGTLDENDGTLSGPIAPLPGTYQIDSSGVGATFGRGTMSFDSRSFAFYIVNSTHIKLLEEDIAAAIQGDANLQSGAIPTQNSAVNGGFVFMVSGAFLVGSQGLTSRIGRFTTDGMGGFANLSFDQNYAGNYTHVSQGSNITNASFAIDTAHAGSGRGTFTFTDSNLGLLSYVFYLSSPTQAVIQDVTPHIVADGPMQAQLGAPFSNATLAGNYQFFWNGIQTGRENFVPSNENFVGQYVLSSATKSNISGIMDYAEQGTTGSTFYPSIGIAGTLSIDSDGSTNNDLQVVSGSPSSTTFNFVAYVVSPSTAYAICIDGTRVTTAIATQQSQ
jgi:hypothetical protein